MIPGEIPDVTFNESFYMPTFLMMSNEGAFKGIDYDADMMRYLTIKIITRISDMSVVPAVFNPVDVGIR